ncbi:LBX1 factor, partial [Amia calva]|nr:LBX1 factor [Amia calva]
MQNKEASNINLICVFIGRDGMTIFGQRNTPKKRRKSRTAFTNHQIYELEKRFLYQKYLSPADRDQIAQQLGLTNAQVITWFQNRRAKLKRDLEEMKADVESAKALGTVPLEKMAKLADLEKSAAGTLGNSRSDSPTLSSHGQETPNKLQMSPSSPFTDHATSQECSEDEDVEIDVDD